MLRAIFLSFTLLSSAVAAPKSPKADPRALLTRMGEAADRLNVLLAELEEPAAKKDPARYKASLDELSKLDAKADALGAKADAALKRADLPRSAEPVVLRRARTSWLDTSEDDPGVRAQELAGARLNVLAAQYSLLALALSSEDRAGEKFTCRGELDKAREELVKLKKSRGVR